MKIVSWPYLRITVVNYVIAEVYWMCVKPLNTVFSFDEVSEGAEINFISI
jgi:hypothetical protein